MSADELELVRSGPHLAMEGGICGPLRPCNWVVRGRGGFIALPCVPVLLLVEMEPAEPHETGEVDRGDDPLNVSDDADVGLLLIPLDVLVIDDLADFN